MMAQQPGNFDDEGLKAAIQRAWGRESASPQLQRSIAALLAGAAQPQPTQHQAPQQPQQSRPISRPTEQQPSRLSIRPRWYPIAASILCLLGVGWLSYTLYSEYRPVGSTVAIGPNGKPTFDLPQNYLKDMVARHDDALASAATAPSSPVQLASLETLKADLSKQINNPVAVISPGEQWTLKSARATTIADSRAAEFLFVKNDSPGTSVSLFSVPVFHPYTPPSGAEYNQSYEGRAIAGFVNKDMIYCILLHSPDGSVKIAQLEPLRAQLEGLCNH